MFDPNEKPMRKHRLRVYRKDPDGPEPLPDAHYQQDQDTDLEIGSVIVVGNGNGLSKNKINKIDSKIDSDYENEPEDYPTLQSINK